MLENLQTVVMITVALVCHAAGAMLLVVFGHIIGVVKGNPAAIARETPALKIASIAGIGMLLVGNLLLVLA